MYFRGELICIAVLFFAVTQALHVNVNRNPRKASVDGSLLDKRRPARTGPPLAFDHHGAPLDLRESSSFVIGGDGAKQAAKKGGEVPANGANGGQPLSNNDHNAAGLPEAKRLATKLRALADELEHRTPPKNKNSANGGEHAGEITEEKVRSILLATLKNQNLFDVPDES